VEKNIKLQTNNDFQAIQKNLKKYINHELSELEMIGNIDMLALSTFDTSSTHELYELINNAISHIEILYFMKGEVSFHPDIIKAVTKFYDELTNFSQNTSYDV